MAQPYEYGSYPPTSQAPTACISRPQRVWPALLTLFFLAPIIPEMLTGSTPPLMFINPISLLFETGLYGSGAILIRELVRRRGGINHTRALSCATRKAQCKHCSVEAYYVILGIE